MDAATAKSYIESYSWSSTKLGLARTRDLLNKMGSPQNELKFIHVAGTNGKGSTCAMLASILQSAGYKTGLYTSPHISSFNERMQINGEEIPDDQLANITSKVFLIAETMADHPSQFELATAIAMEYFANEKCDIVVLEVGLGGVLDSTNVIDDPEVAVITNIGLEHKEYLGNTLAEIASAKAGIIKSSCDVVCYRSVPEVEDIFEKVCEDRKARLHKADFDSIKPISWNLTEQVFSWRDLEYLHMPLLGDHQLKNAAVALHTISILRRKGYIITDMEIHQGLTNTKWPVRFEVLSKSPLIIVDGAHNPQCAQMLSENIGKYLPEQKCTFLIGVLADKDYPALLDYLRPYAKDFICVSPPNPRALNSFKLAEYLQSIGEVAISCCSIYDGAKLALLSDGPVLACGSLYMCSVVRKSFLSLISPIMLTCVSNDY